MRVQLLILVQGRPAGGLVATAALTPCGDECACAQSRLELFSISEILNAASSFFVIFVQLCKRVIIVCLPYSKPLTRGEVGSPYCVKPSSIISPVCSFTQIGF